VAALFRDHHGELVRLAVLMVGDLPTGAVLGTEYRLVTGPGGQSPRDITFAADASGQHQLLAYSVGGGWRIGWLGQGQLHRLPVRQASPRFSITAW
jgi:hypothetical protein